MDRRVHMTAAIFKPAVIRRIRTDGTCLAFQRCFSVSLIKAQAYTERDVPASYTISKSFVEWFKSRLPSQSQRTQDELLKLNMPYYNSNQVNSSDLKAVNIQTQVPSGNFLNEVRVSNSVTNDEKTKHLVMVHGYAASLGWFYKNFHDLIKDNKNTTIHALDMLGFGLSAKPKVNYNEKTTRRPLHIQYNPESMKQYKHVHKSLVLPDSYSIDVANLLDYAKEQKPLVENVESIYIDSIEEWRIHNKIERFDLLGHSLGGYLSLAYALKYPERVDKLILVSPGGVERTPFALSNPKVQKVLEKFKENPSNIPKTLTYSTSHSPADYGFLGRYPLIKENFKKIWYNYISFFTFLRLSGPFGPYLLSKYTFKKLARKNVIDKYSEIDTFTSYIYNSFTRKSFSETAIMRIFTSSIVAKYPMLDRIHELKSETLWLYGEHDWMYNDCGRVAVDLLNSREKADNNNSNVKEAKFDIVSKAGHNLYLDNALEFNAKVKDFLGWK